VVVFGDPGVYVDVQNIVETSEPFKENIDSSKVLEVEFIVTKDVAGCRRDLTVLALLIHGELPNRPLLACNFAI
jgi:hypothetical protein